jgi:thymidine phosphorylase
MKNNISDDEAKDLTENYIRVGMDAVHESIQTINQTYKEAGLTEPTMPTLLYGMATTLFETMYACAPTEEEAEKILNMALETGKANAVEFKKAMEKKGGPLFGGGKHE